MRAKWKRWKSMQNLFPLVHRNLRRSSSKNGNYYSPGVPSRFDFDHDYDESQKRYSNAGFCPCLKEYLLTITNCTISKSILLKLFLLLIVASIISLGVYYKISTDNYFRILHEDVHQVTKHFHLKKCNFPKLRPFSDEILAHLKKPHSINCAHTSNPGGEIVFVQGRGKPLLKRVIDVDGSCCYRPFHRVEDDESESESRCIKITSKVTVIPEEHEFVEVICVGGSQDYRDGFAFVNKKPEVEAWLQNVDEAMDQTPQRTTGEGERTSVIVLGLDATSHMNFLRTMPKSNSYLLKNLSAVVMEGYTKVASNTLPNVIPLLTGQTFQEFKTRCVDSKESHEVHLDSCPFIWKKFSANGFRTGFAEDDVDIGTFNMDWRHAFENVPVDYYLRPFSTLMQHKQSSGDGLCYGTRLSFKVLLDNLENYVVALKDQLLFHFTWSTKLSHDSFNTLSLGDVPLLKFLKFMHKGNHLNSTVLILMSDHGSRTNEIRKTSQGKIEDRMPLLYVILPPWFSTRFPAAYENLKYNSERLTSAFDVFQTLNDFMDLSRLDNLKDDLDFAYFDGLERKPYSLFQKIPDNRTCLEAGVPLHWCVCRGDSVDRKVINVDDNLEVRSAVQYAIDSMNFHLRRQPACSTLTYHKTTDAFYIDFESKVEQVSASGQILTILRVSFLTMPGNGAFEATLVQSVGGGWVLTEQVVRINEYGDQSNCVEQQFKEFCYCE